MDFKVHSMVWLCLKNIKNSSFYKTKNIVMKVLLFILTVAASLQVSASAFSQIINLSVKNLSFENVLNQIEKQSGYKVFYDLEHLKVANPVTVNLKNAPLQKTLEECFKNQPFTYQIVAKTIIIKSQKASTKKTTVSGKVTDDKGLEMPGVMVRIKNGSTGTVTNSNGVYSISVPDENTDVLTFSFLGFVTQEIEVKGRTVINVRLSEDQKKLNEIVVIGYGSVQRSDLTGAVASVNMADLAKAPVTSFDEALAGRIAGVTVSSTDGQPGSTSNIVIRGPGSITQDNSPLYVIDGFPMEDSDNSSINPSDIESIDILKDASATAIYGSRGANGVIIITTKKGKKGDPVITFNSYYGLQKNTNRVETLSPYEFVRLQLELGNGAAGSKTPAAIYTPGDLDPSEQYYDANGNTLESYKNSKGLYLEDQYFRTAAVQNYDLSIRGGTDKTLYSISGNYRDMDGIVINSGLKRYQGRITLDQTVNKNLKIGTNINYSRNENFGSIHNGASENPSLYQMYSVWGYRPVTGTEELNIDEELFDDEAMSGDDYRFNPIISVKNEIRRTASNMLTANGFAEYGFNKYLKLRVSGGLTTRFGVSENFNNSQTVQGNSMLNPSRGVNGSIYNTSATNLLNENILSYIRTFNKVHKINAIVGYNMQTNKTSRSGFSAVLVPNEDLEIDGLDEAIKNFGNVGSSSWGLLSYLGRMIYSYNGKYIFTGTFRADGSSKFLKENRWGYFPSGAVSWVVSKEEFFKKQNIFTNLKLRASYGLTGNNRIGDFDYLTQITFPLAGNYSYKNSIVQGAVISTIGNPLLKWETTKQSDIGVEMGFLRDRITFEFDYYNKVTDDLLLNADLPRTTGINTAFKNVGKMSNEGFEFSLNTKNVHSKDFQWSSSFNISFNRNKVLALSDKQNVLARTVNFNSSYSSLYSYISILGQPIGQMYGLIYDGVYQVEDFNIDGNGKYVLKNNIPLNGNSQTVIQPGHIKYKDLNDDGNITTSDYAIIGRGLPIHTGGFTNNFNYKNFDLNVLLQWSYGNDLINANRFLFEGGGRRNLNQFASFANRWTFDNQDSDIPRAGGQGPAHFSNRVLEDGSYLRLKTVSLGYNVPSALAKRNGIKSLRVYASAQNLLTWTNYTGADPEVSVGYSTLTQGFDYAAYPRAKTITFGLNLSF